MYVGMLRQMYEYVGMYVIQMYAVCRYYVTRTTLRSPAERVAPGRGEVNITPPC